MRVQPFIKETYEQIPNDNPEVLEFNEINPYIQAIGKIKEKYPDAKIIRTKTVFDVIGTLQFPILEVYFERT
jgi:hypothetical protein